MPVVNYHSANGRLIGETTSGVRTDYMSDALGSVTGTLNASQAVVNTYRYKPYGELLAKTGSAADPAFMWNGTTQSRRTGLTFSDQYNRARHYGTKQGQWTTVDPLWPREMAYGYAFENATTLSDPYGRTPTTIGGGCPSDFQEDLKKACELLDETLKDEKKKNDILSCMKGKGHKPDEIAKLLSCMNNHCGSPDNCYVCSSGPGNGFPSNWPSACTEIMCADFTNNVGATPMPLPEGSGITPNRCRPYDTEDQLKDCTAALRGLYPKCKSITLMCTNAPGRKEWGKPNWQITVWHEMAHACSGMLHPKAGPKPKPNTKPKPDFFDDFDCCMCRVMPFSKDCGNMGITGCATK